MPDRKVVILPAARRDIEAIYAYSLDRFGSDVADHYLQSIRSTIDSLARFAESGTPVGRSDPTARERIVRSHVIRYIVDETAMTIMRIYHERANRDSSGN